MNSITCPHCGKPVEISHALKLQIENEVRSSTEEEYKAKLEASVEEVRKKNA